jgi:hypothetical protein
MLESLGQKIAGLLPVLFPRKGRRDAEQAVSALEIVHEQVGTESAHDCAQAMGLLWAAMNPYGSAKARGSRIVAAEEWLRHLDRSRLKINECDEHEHFIKVIFSALHDNGASCLDSLKGGDFHTAAFLFDCMVANAVGLFDFYRIGGQIEPNFPDPLDIRPIGLL